MQNLSSIFLPNKEITCEEYPVNFNNIASVVEQYGGQLIDDLVLLQDQLRLLYPLQLQMNSLHVEQWPVASTYDVSY